MTDTDKINPAWKPLLDKLPPEFHSIIMPDLKAWDQGVQSKFQEIHTSYENLKGFKTFVDNNIDVDYAMEAVRLADSLQSNPEAIVSKINEAWGLGFIPKEEAAKLGQQSAGEGTDNDDLFDEGKLENFDIMKHPQVKAMYDTIQQFQSTFEQDKQKEEEEAAIQQFESDLDALEAATKEKNLPFNRTFVTALMAQGIEGEDAVKEYHQILATTATTNDTQDNGSEENPPVVMGNGGSVGAGVSDGSVSFGQMKPTDLNNTIEQLLAQAAESGQ